MTQLASSWGSSCYHFVRMALQSWSCAIGCGNVSASRLISIAPVACCKSASRIGTPAQLRRSARSLQTKASSASVDTFLEKPFADESYEVPVHTVIVHDRQRDVTHTFEVPEVRIHNSFPFQPSLQEHCSGGWGAHPPLLLCLLCAGPVHSPHRRRRWTRPSVCVQTR